jgi:flagellar protein FlaF
VILGDVSFAALANDAKLHERRKDAMYQFTYAEVLEETPQGARERERQAIDRSIEMLEAADKAGPQSRESIEALHYLRRLWGLLMEDLSKPENDLPERLRADLISIGLWIMREAEDIRLEKSSNFRGIIEVSQNIRDGLAE